jgi:septum formation protein
MKQQIILASTSPRRKELLKQIGINFKIIPSNYKEDINLKLSNTNLAKVLALGKAKDVSGKLKEGIVIGSDTFIVFKNKRIGKPKNKKEAKKILKMISGKKIKIYSGVAIIDIKKNNKITDCEITEIKMKKLTPGEIDSYIKTGEPLDKAGAFGIQGMGAVFIEKINGCYSNIVGLPLNNLYKNLSKLNINIFEK